MSLAYLYSRYPVVSQTFCDSEMLALEALGRQLVVASLNPPPNSFRHERLRNLQAEILYPPPAPVLKAVTVPAAMAALAAEHDARHGAGFKAGTRARNAAWFAPALARRGVRHVHVHFANRATHTALFLKQAGFTFSFTAHAQDYMVDLGSDDLLRELAREAEFVIAVSDFSRDDLRRRCPDEAAKIHRIYNGLRLDDFPPARPAAHPAPLRVVSVGRLIEFKGFHHLIDAIGRLRDTGVEATLDLIGDGPWREPLAAQIERRALGDRVRLSGVLSQDAIKARLAASDVFALACCVGASGASDILPTVIMEAMAARLPVVSTRVAGVPEMVADGVTGLLAPPDDPAALADALARLAADPGLRTSLGDAGRDRCAAMFSLDQTAAALEARFREVEMREEATGVRPAAASPPPPVLVLSTAAAEPEWAALAGATGASATPGLGVLAAGSSGGPAPAWLEFLPDAIVLEAAWRADPAAAAACEALYAGLDSTIGESFFRDARRAVHTADCVRKRGHRQVHAARAETVVWAWLVRKLTGIRATCTIEPSPTVPRSLLTRLLPDFEILSLADDKLRAEFPGAPPDRLALAPPRKSGIFGGPRPPQPDWPAFHRALLGDA
jgi:glycosyltransferase involved in cell wall biosynthesis